MAEALVSDILKQLASIAAREAEQGIGLVVGIEEDVGRLESHLQTIMPMLNDAEKQQVNWLDDLIDACYEIEDVLDEWNTAIIKSEIEIEEEHAENGNDKVNKLPLCLRIAHKIKELTRKMDGIFITFTIEPERHVNDKEVELPRSTSFIDVSDICGHVRDMDNLLSNLLGKGSYLERSPHVISLVGMGGIGKTTLAQLAFNDDNVKAHFERRSWVCVSKPFDGIRIAKEIIRDVEGDFPNIDDLSRLFKRIVNLIRGKKFFFVLDDVWTEDYTQWEPFRSALNYGAQGSRILVTTRNLEVATMMGSAYTITLNVLSEEDCWLLFSKVAFFEKDSQCQLLEDLGREIAKKCKGLPLIAKVLGSLMRFKKSREQWKDVVDSNLWEFEDAEGCQFTPLLLSYNDLPSALKRCFSYCAIFPKDKVIHVKELIQMWMAQNYLNAKGSMEMEILGQQYFENLAMRSFFHDFERATNDDRIICCKMHDIMHDFVRLLMKNECFAIAVDGKESGTTSSFESARHLSLKFERKTQFPMSVYNVKNLRTLLTSNIRLVSINTALPDLFQHLTCLRALNLRSSSIEKLPDEIEKLVHLRFLDLSSSYSIEALPETMCNLCNLQSLDVSKCYILEKLPQGMAKLINLRHLILNGTNFMKMFPKGIGKLKSLRTLTKFIVGGNDESEGCKLGDMKDMNHLEGALEIKGLGNVVDVHEAKNALLNEKVHLRSLCLDFDGEGKKNRKLENGVLVVDALMPHPALEHLEISGTVVFPKWLMSLTKLKKLKLSSVGMLEPLPPLGKLPFLESLEILDVDGVKKVGVEFLGIESNKKEDEGLTSSLILFPNLNSLTFSGLKELEEWDGIGWMRNEGGSVLIMPRLQILKILDCPKLKALPDFLEKNSLHELRFDSSQISNWNMFSNSILTNLKVLELKLCKNLRHLPSFGKLPFLESLSLWNADGVENVGIDFLGVEAADGIIKLEYDFWLNESDQVKRLAEKLAETLVIFPNLRILEFWSFGEWKEWDGIKGIRGWNRSNISIMPHLHSLIIYNCPKLKSLPHFLPSTPLEDLRISGSPILKNFFQWSTGDGWDRIPKIEIIDGAKNDNH